MTDTRGRRFYSITNRFMFGRIFSDPDNARPFLEAVLGVPIGEIRYIDEERTIEPSISGKGVRMDVFVADGTGTVYDIEMQNADDYDLALRSRYLLSSFDRDRIERGDEYVNLGRSIVIFVCTFDPLACGDRLYTVRPMVEGRGLPFDDGTLRVFLNAAGAAGRSEPVAPALNANDIEAARRISAFLSYVDGGGTMGDEWVARLDAEVHALNADPGWRDTMVSYEMILQDERRRSRKQGHDEGFAEGHDEGFAEGHNEGFAKGRAEGHDEGFAKGRAEGRDEGFAKGRAEGRDEGFAKGRAEGHDEGFAEGRDEGFVEGRAEGLTQARLEYEQLDRLLAQRLRELGREGELVDALLDPSVKATLLAEFGLGEDCRPGESGD